jgi:hypothetical protein
MFHEGHVRPQEPKEHILRSRQTEISSDDLDMNYDMSTVKFALMVLGDIVSDIVLLNEQPHTIQNRLLGQTLLSVWLWLSKNQNEYDEMIAADEPAETYLRRLKSSWEEVAGDEWKRYAYTPDYMIAKRMLAMPWDGVRRVVDIEIGRSIVDDSQKLHYDKRARASILT